MHCRVEKIGNTSLRFDFRVFGDGGEREIAAGEILVVIAKRDTYQKTSVPNRLRESIEAFERFEA
jgi:acyl-CoA thioesterase FadM